MSGISTRDTQAVLSAAREILRRSKEVLERTETLLHRSRQSMRAGLSTDKGKPKKTTE
jgi:hypothetical protein